MSARTATLAKHQNDTYSFNRSLIPFSKMQQEERVKPPDSNFNVIDSRHLFEKKSSLTPEQEELIRRRDTYLKAERMVIVNFFTGGTVYKKGAMDVIYKGFNPMK